MSENHLRKSFRRHSGRRKCLLCGISRSCLTIVLKVSGDFVTGLDFESVLNRLSWIIHAVSLNSWMNIFQLILQQTLPWRSRCWYRGSCSGSKRKWKGVFLTNPRFVIDKIPTVFRCGAIWGKKVRIRAILRSWSTGRCYGWSNDRGIFMFNRETCLMLKNDVNFLRSLMNHIPNRLW